MVRVSRRKRRGSSRTTIDGGRNLAASSEERAFLHGPPGVPERSACRIQGKVERCVERLPFSQTLGGVAYGLGTCPQLPVNVAPGCLSRLDDVLCPVPNLAPDMAHPIPGLSGNVAGAPPDFACNVRRSTGNFAAYVAHYARGLDAGPVSEPPRVGRVGTEGDDPDSRHGRKK